MNKTELTQMLADPAAVYRPEVRWWLAEGLNTDKTLREEVARIHDYGFGATEFLAVPEAGCDSARYGWGSEEWVHDSRVIIGEDTKYGMGASMTSGANWSNANLITITPDDKAASKELDYTFRILSPGEAFDGELEKAAVSVPGVKEQVLIAVTASKLLREESGYMVLDPDSTAVLTGTVRNGTLFWRAPEDGPWVLNTFWLHGTGQTAEPSCRTSYTINYLDPYGVEAWIRYWDGEVLTPDMKELISRNGRVQIYMDSLELTVSGRGGNLWGYRLLDTFRERRGYDLTPYLPFVLRRGVMFDDLQYRYEMEDTGRAEKIRNDLYQTMTDLYKENVLRPIRDYCHQNNMTLRAEISYGVTFEITQPGKYVDGIETESLEFGSQLDSHRALAGPAHIYGKVYSAETGAAMCNYMKGMEWYTQIIYTQFAAGVTKTVLHGYSSIRGSEEATYWPGHEGMEPYYSDRFSERQPAARHYRAWTNMLARYQMLLRAGKPRMDLAILRTDYYFNNQIMGISDLPADAIYFDSLMRAGEGLYWMDTTLQNMGYTYDYFDPSLLFDADTDGTALAPDGPGYRALVLYQEALSLENAERILYLARKGLPVLFANGIRERTRNTVFIRHEAAAVKTPFLDGKEEALAEVVAEMKALPNVAECEGYEGAPAALASLGVFPRVSFAEKSRNMLPLLREDGEMRYLYLYNVMDREEAPAAVTLRVEGEGVPYRVDCWSGEVTDAGPYRIEDGRTVFDAELMPGEAAMFAVNRGETAKERGLPAPAAGPVSRIPLSDWTLRVEDWDEGGKVVEEEDRGLGYVTREAYYTTRKTVIDAGKTGLVPWKDIPAVGPAVSGVGYYETVFMLPEDFREGMRAVLTLGSTNECSAAVIVNGVTFPFDFNRLSCDVTKALRRGENRITVEIAATLNNRLLERGYYKDTVPAALIRLCGCGVIAELRSCETGRRLLDQIYWGCTTSVKDYGLTGEAEITFYEQ